jgi:hypothetical protein
MCPNDCTDASHGQCTAVDAGPPQCICKEGWSLGPFKDCSVSTCVTMQCSSKRVCELTELFSFTTTASKMCPGFNYQECTGNGQCNSTSGLCTCASGWRGLDCSIGEYLWLACCAPSCITLTFSVVCFMANCDSRLPRVPLRPFHCPPLLLYCSSLTHRETGALIVTREVNAWLTLSTACTRAIAAADGLELTARSVRLHVTSESAHR